MGRMKEIFIEICNANDGQLPGDITTGDVIRMKELEIYNWEQYEKELKKEICLFLLTTLHGRNSGF